MSLRKIAALLAAAGLAVGLIGGGVGAQFTGQVSAQENLNVGTFGCLITDASGRHAQRRRLGLYYDAGTDRTARLPAACRRLHGQVDGHDPGRAQYRGDAAALRRSSTCLPTTP